MKVCNRAPWEGRSSSGVLPLKWKTSLHPLGVFWSRPPTRGKSVGGTSKGTGDYLAVEAIILKEMCVYVQRVHLPLDFFTCSPHFWPLTSIFLLLWKGNQPIVPRQVYCRRPRNEGLGMLDLASHWLVKRLAFLPWSLMRDAAFGHKVRAVFLNLISNPEAENRFKSRDETPYFCECRSVLCKLPQPSDLSQESRVTGVWCCVCGSTRESGPPYRWRSYIITLSFRALSGSLGMRCSTLTGPLQRS